ncbi:MAG: hypothetical protein M1816_004496 [Peltula sp. TS41687]|nr:MAG: hypothetical protein M1816_004496 [Peltula sp. TS41687]
MAQDTVDLSSNASNGLHNMLTGLTLQSPLPSPPPGRRSVATDTDANADAVLTSPPTVEQTTPQSNLIQFNTPTRSIFSSGPPTSSVSVNTALASMAGAPPGNGPRPFLHLAVTSSDLSPMPNILDIEGHPNTEIINDTDEPGPAAVEQTTSDHTATSTAPSASTKPVSTTTRSPTTSSRPSNGNKFHHRRVMETAPLPDHLYTQGFRHGRHSDITVHAFSTSYALHRLLLDRSPFFSVALSGPWLESNAKDITLHPEKVDPNITKEAFELALGRIYGSSHPAEEKEVATSLLATGCWLEMTDLIDCSVHHVISQMKTENLPQLIEMVTSNEYGKPGRQILLAAKAMLCREGWELPLEHWDGIPGYVVRHVVGSDAFFVPGEWQRWVLAKKLLNQRLKISLAKSARTRASGPETKSCCDRNRDRSHEIREVLRSAYLSSDVEEILALLEHHIYYTHMTFEQLQLIEGQVDFLGERVVPPDTITKALWMSTELRQRVLNQPESKDRLDLKHESPYKDSHRPMSPSELSTDSDTEPDGHAHQLGSTELDKYRRHTREFKIPAIDSTRVLGHTAAEFAPAKNSFLPKPHMLQYSAMLAEQSNSPSYFKPLRQKISSHYSYSEMPPYRFAVQFPNPLYVEEKERIYSRIISYAGSMWNVYIQKHKMKENFQLGVYLHRVRNKRTADEALGGSPGPRSVDEAISNLEREIFMRRGRKVQRQRSGAETHTSDNDPSLPRMSSGNGLPTDGEQTAVPPDQTNKSKLGRDKEDEENELDWGFRRQMHGDIPPMPPYADKRWAISTYFKIYELSPDGRAMTVHKSMPDLFTFSQSWGWKTLMDESRFKEDSKDGVPSKAKPLRFTIVLGNV